MQNQSKFSTLTQRPIITIVGKKNKQFFCSRRLLNAESINFQGINVGTMKLCIEKILSWFICGLVQTILFLKTIKETLTKNTVLCNNNTNIEFLHLNFFFTKI